MPVVTIVVFGVAIAINLAAVAISIALAVIVAVVSRALIKKPKRNPLTFENRTLTVRQPISPRQVVIGENRVGGTLVFARRAGASNADVWLVIAWTGHESQRLGNIYTDEDRNVLNSDGSVDGTLAGKLFVWHHLGSTSQTADAQMLATFPSIWTDRHQLLGCGYSVVRLVGLAANYQNSVPNLSVDVKGLKYLDYRTGLTDYSDNPAMAVAWLLQNTEFGLGEPNSFIDVSNFRFEANIHDELQNLNPIVDYLTADQATTVTTNASTDNWGLTFDIRLYTGDLIQLGIEGGGTLPTVVGTPLVDTGTYYWRRVSATVGRLYHTQQDAIDNTNVIDVTALGTGTMSIVAHGGDWKWGGVETAIIVNTTADTIRAVTPSADIRRDFSFWLGAKVRMHGTTAPGGTTEGTRYICGGRNELSGFYETEIFTTITNLEAGTQVNLTTAGSAPRVTLDGMVIKWQIVNQVLGTINGHRFSTGLGGPTVQCPTGTAVTVTGAGATLPRPLVEEQVCFWVNLESGYGQLCGLARTYSDALRGLLIAFDDVGSSGTQEYYVETEFTHSAAMRNLVTGERISSTILLETGGNQSVVDAATSYWIRTGRDTGKLATTRANALKGIADGPAPEVQSLNADTVPYPSNTYFRTGQPRFTCNGVFDADMDIEEVLRGLGSSFAGAILEPFGSGQWRIKSGVFRMPLDELTQNDIRAGSKISVSMRIPRSEAINTVKALFAGPLNFDQAADAPVISDIRFITEDRGEVLHTTLILPFTNSVDMVRRLQLIELYKKRKQRTIQFPTTVNKALDFEYADVILVTLPRYKYVKKPFEIVQWTFGLQGSKRMLGSGGSSGGGGNLQVPVPTIDLVLREINESVYM